MMVPDIEAMLMIEPLRRASILRASAWQDRNTPATLTSWTFRHFSSDSVSAASEPAMPALLTATVSGAEFGLDAIDRHREIGLGRHGAGKDQRLAAECRDPVGGFVQPTLRCMAETGDVGARLGQSDRNCLADAAAGAGDQRDVSVQIEEIHRYPP